MLRLDRRTLPALCAVAWAVAPRGPSRGEPVFRAPAGARYAAIDRAGVTVLPNGRLLTPAGRQVPTAPHPFGLTLSADGRVLVTVNGGVGPFSLTVIEGPQGDSPRVRQFPASAATDKRVLPSAFLGAAVDSGRGLVYASGANEGTVVVFSLASGLKLASVDLSGAAFPDSYVTDIALSADGRWLYALDLGHFRFVVVDALSRQPAASLGVGRNPFALALTPDGRSAYVANMGTFQYAPVETLPGHDPRGLAFPPFGYPSRAAREGTVVAGRRVPGLGDPNAPEACSVWGIDLSDPRRPRVCVRLKTGLPVGQALGGSSPAGLAVSADTLYVSNSTNDTVEAYDLASHTRRWQALLAPRPSLRHLRGVTPFGLALAPDGRRLYVAESGLNAVAVLSTADGSVRGHIPVGWYPAGLAVSPDGSRLYVSNAKGYGAGPNGGAGFRAGPEGNYIGRLMKGTVSLIPAPAEGALAALTGRVLRNNGLVPVRAARPPGHPIPLRRSERASPIRHVVLIAKENRTFDEVFGDLPGVEGDPRLARFGADRAVGPHRGVTVMPNHRALARRFAIKDNFYVDSDVSSDGHRWLVGAYANHWAETVTAAGYGGGAVFSRKAPGRLAFFGSNSSLTPEDYLEHGSLWEHLERHGVSFRNYGEGFELAGNAPEPGTEPTGARLPVNMPMPEALFRNTARDYPGYNMNISDQYRADAFLREFRARYLSGREPLPRFLYIFLPADHGGATRPERGYPYLESYMADNDLALGRIVEALSASPFWKQMAVFVTEDDAQSGVDHVDAHRSLCLVISPWARRGHVSRSQASIASILKTTYLILGLPSLNLYDALASDLSEMFAPEPDFSPYQVQPVDPRIFNPSRLPRPTPDRTGRAQAGENPPLDAVEEALRQLPPER